jgi:L-threonylcarbamoyladenylate synthase
LILDRGARVPDEVTGGQNTVGLRVPAHPLARALISELGADCGVAAPSANKFGRVSPTEARHVFSDLGDEVDFVLDGGPCAVGIESTIVDLSGDRVSILRPGGVSKEAIEEVLGRRVEIKTEGPVRAPGMLASHYAPEAEVVLAPAHQLAARVREYLERGSRVAVLASTPLDLPKGTIELEKPQTPDDLAHQLYRALRDADARGAQVVVVEAPEERGIGLAILDRLKKASSRGV